MLNKLIDTILKEESIIVDEIKGGKEKAINQIIGKVLTKGAFNPSEVDEIIRDKLSLPKKKEKVLLKKTDKPTFLIKPHTKVTKKNGKLHMNNLYELEDGVIFDVNNMQAYNKESEMLLEYYESVIINYE